MKNMKYRSIILYGVIIAFFAGIFFFIYEYINNAQKWAFSPINGHFRDGSIVSGKIVDSKGEILMQTLDGKKVYNSDEGVRKALLHTVGDGVSLIPTCVQNRYSGNLFGYNIISGFGGASYINSARNIKLTLDSKVCSKVSKSFKGRKGAAIAYNYLTGEVICMVSLPTYDINNRPDLSKDDDAYEGVYINRALSASYTPGSIFKIFTSAASLDYMNDAETRKYNCQKIKIVDGEKVTCMQNHGNLDLKNALSKSCDIAFCDIALELGKDKMTSKMESFGFNNPQYFEGLELSNSCYDVSKASKADLGWSGIGQYTL